MKKQIKLLLLYFILSFFTKSYSQDFEINLSPEGKLETIYDNQGSQLKLKDILINAPKKSGILTTTSLSCSTTSYFNLYFEPGCGMEDISNPTHNARRAVMCKVFEDISNFITSPLSTTGNKVNIWVRNIANESAPTGTLGLASSFYIPYSNSANTIGGILDGEIWKTIHLGVDSYTNITSGTNTFYHGKISFNFNDPSINWNTNLAINTPSNLYDLYTVILHEVTHSLGFGSFINQNGASIDPSPYYSRYDTFLRTNANIPLLTIGSCSMYDVSFNSAVSPTVLRPGCTFPNNLSTGVLNNTTCVNAIKYVGSSTVPVYTPTCFEQGSSLSHFEDMLYPTCASPYGNDSYFVLSNVNLLGVTKRYLKPEERNVLCDIGYNLKTTFGVSTTSNGFYNYGGTICTGISVAGVNDGINSNGSYTFIGSIATTGATSTSVSISGLLANDVNTTSFECLQDITAPSTTSIVNISGTNTTVSSFTTTSPGLHILRYIPVNGTQRGNITYVYVYIATPPPADGCSPVPKACDLIMNGNFEQYSSLPTSFYQIFKACGWNTPISNTNGQWTPSYFNSNVIATSSPNSYMVDVPCNLYGKQDSNNNIGNGYSTIVTHRHGGKQHLYTMLKEQLQPNTNYQISFDVSLPEGKSNFASSLQVYLSNTNLISFNTATNFEINTVPNPSMLLTSPIIIRNINGWDTVTFNFTTTTGGEKYLYLGLLKNVIISTNTPAPIDTTCNLNNTTTDSYSQFLAYYIDNVSLIPNNGAVLNLPTLICNTQNLNDLSLYLSGTTTNGVFSGNGVIFASGAYSFNASVAGIGTTTIGYTFTNSSGCATTLYDTINISTTSSNTIVVDAINDNFSSLPIISASGGVSASVYANDFYNGTASSSASLLNVNFALVTPLSIAGATINSSGLISIPAGTAAGTYTLTYRLSAIGNCNTSDTATVTIVVTNNNTTPPIVSGIRANNAVTHIGLQNSGKSIIAGYFTTYNNITKKYIARLNTDLTLDTSFNFIAPTTTRYFTYGLAIQPDNKIIVVMGSNNGYIFKRLLSDGIIDSSFNLGGAGTLERTGYTNNAPVSCVIQSDGKILLGGDFYYYNGIQRLGIVRTNTDGSIDTSFNPIELNTYYRAICNKILLQPNGKIVLLGIFLSGSSGATEKNVIRLNEDGTIDTSFYIGNTLGGATYNPIFGFDERFILQPDNKIILVGAFTKYNGINVNNIVRLMSDGQLDSTFNSVVGTDKPIRDVLLEPITNKIILGGEFTTFNGSPVNKMLRLNTNGTLDTTFNIGSGITDNNVGQTPYTRSSVLVLKQQPDEKIIVGGKYTAFNGLSATNITRIFGAAGMQAKSSITVYQSEPEIDINLNNEPEIVTNNNHKSITIYPNPSKGIYTIDLSSEKEPTNITIYNILGELVYNQLLLPETQNQIDLTYLANGYYIARISNELRNMQLKLIKN